MEQEKNPKAQFYKALSALQGELEFVKKDNEGQLGNRKFKYADLPSIYEVIQHLLKKHEFCVLQLLINIGEKPGIRTILGHSSGHDIIEEITIDYPGSDIKTFGGSITYYRRYAISALLGIVTSDDPDSTDDTIKKDDKPKSTGLSKISNDQIRYLSGMVTPDISDKVQAALVSRGYDSLADVLAIDFALFESGIKKLLVKEVKQ